MPPKPPRRAPDPDHEPIHLDKLPPLYARPRAADNAVDDAEREDPSLSQHSQQRGGVGTRAIARELTQEELDLAEELQRDWGFVGARAFVAQYAPNLIQEAMNDFRNTSRRDIRNPAGFLRWVVQQRSEP